MEPISESGTRPVGPAAEKAPRTEGSSRGAAGEAPARAADLKLVLDTIPQPAWSALPDGQVEFCNQRWLDYTGMDAERAKGWGWTEAIHPGDLDGLLGLWRAAMQARQPAEAEARIRRADGVYRWFLIRAMPLAGPDGRVIRWYGTNTDIEERKQAEQALAKSEERWRTVFDNSAIGVALTDLEGRFFAANAAFQKMLGYTEEELRSLSFLDITQEDYHEQNKALVQELLEGRRREFQIEKQYRRKDGSLIWVRTNGSLVPGTDTMPQFLLGLSENITERKRAELEWKRLASIVEKSGDLMAYADMDSRVLYVNPAGQKMFGLDGPEEVRRSNRRDYFTPEDWERVRQEVMPAVLAHGSWRGEVRCRHFKTGETIPAIYDSFLVNDPETGRPAGFAAIIRDITQQKKSEEMLQHERDRLALLLELNNSLVSRLDLPRLFQGISAGLRRAMSCDFANLKLLDPETGSLRLHLLDHPEGKGLLREGMQVPLTGSASGWAFRARQPAVFESLEEARANPDIFRGPEGEKFYQVLRAEGIRSACNVPLLRGERMLGVLTLASRRERAFAREDVGFLTQIAGQIAIAIDNALQYGEVARARDRLTEEKRYLAEEIRTEHNFEEIIGESAALKRVLKQVETVAPTDSSVLILGETGTGKELIARAIHNLSARHERTFVKVNCAAIPLGLLESELFGHERGAFTGAIAQKIGRFELAHQGTLFLDEIGDIPLELQPKLLRVLQEQEFERLGSTRTIRVNVRVVAATSRDLHKMIEEQRFRSDLYYRLNIFPIEVPPLRERAEDLVLLVRHCVDRFARRMNKRIDVIPDEVMAALTRHRWPGNIRELQNFIERAVILSPGTVLRPPLGELQRASRDSRPAPVTLEEAEREHILEALEECRWVLSGPSGAASRLGLKRTTLAYKMQKLGISRRGR